MKKYIDFLFAGVLAFCSIGLITGIVNLISFFQIITSTINNPNGGGFIYGARQDVFIPRATALSIIALVCVVAVAFACILSFLKKGKASQAVAITVPSLSVIGSFIAIFSVNNLSDLAKYDPYYHVAEIKYYDFTIQQMLAETAKSLFIPIIAVSVMLIVRTLVKKS